MKKSNSSVPSSPSSSSSSSVPEHSDVIVEHSQVVLDNSARPISAAEAAAMALSPSQRTAIEKMTSGHTVCDSAIAAGVSRATLYRWLNQDPKFKAAYNAWQHDAVATARGRLISLTDIAVTTVGNAMRNGDARTAVAVLKSMGILDSVAPGSTDPEEVEQRQLLERQQAASKLGEELFFSSISGGIGKPTAAQLISGLGK